MSGRQRADQRRSLGLRAFSMLIFPRDRITTHNIGGAHKPERPDVREEK
jgi:hypothetical protein